VSHAHVRSSRGYGWYGYGYGWVKPVIAKRGEEGKKVLRPRRRASPRHVRVEARRCQWRDENGG